MAYLDPDLSDSSESSSMPSLIDISHDIIQSKPKKIRFHTKSKKYKKYEPVALRVLDRKIKRNRNIINFVIWGLGWAPRMLIHLPYFRDIKNIEIVKFAIFAYSICIIFYLFYHFFVIHYYDSILITFILPIVILLRLAVYVYICYFRTFQFPLDLKKQNDLIEYIVFVVFDFFASTFTMWYLIPIWFYVHTKGNNDDDFW